MIGNLLSQLPWSDRLHLVLVAMVIFGLSPYGMHLLKRMNGQGRIASGRRPEEIIRDLEAQATRRIRELSDRVALLEHELASVTAHLGSIEAENAALKAHIRAMETPDKPGESPDEKSQFDRAAQDRDDLDELGLEPGASPEDIRRAWVRSVKIHHPDRGGDPETFRRKSAAYERLRRAANG